MGSARKFPSYAFVLMPINLEIVAIKTIKEENSTQISFIFSSSGKINPGSPSWHRCPSSPYPEMLASELPHNISGGKVNSA